DRLADPVAAARALLEDRRDLVDRLFQRAVVRAAADGALHLVRAVRDAAEDAAEEVPGHARRRSEAPDGRGLERRHVAVLALLTVELELISAIGREIFVVSGESNGNHN